MLIGVDLDNTIACCDHLFHRAAVEKGFLGPGVGQAKDAVRDYLRECGKEQAWIELQGYVYGALMPDAEPFPGAVAFFAACKQADIPLCIVSHRTMYPYLGERYDLHQAARDWLEKRGFCGPETGLTNAQVFLELTKQDKLQRIAQLGCTHFIDDLPEFLTLPEFPPRVDRILFDPNARQRQLRGVRRATSWTEIRKWLIGTAARQ